MKPSEEEEFKEKSNEEKMEKEMKNNDEEIDWNDWIIKDFLADSVKFSWCDVSVLFYYVLTHNNHTLILLLCITKKSAVCFCISDRFDFWDSIQGHLLPHSVTQSPNATLLNPGQTSIQVTKSPPGHPAVGS